MELNNLKAEHLKEIERFKKLIEKHEADFNRLEACKQPTMHELYKDIETYFDVNVKHGSYEHILGGDGRSRPWSEERTGYIAEIVIKKNVWLSDEQRTVVKKYVANIHKPDEIKFKIN